MDAGTLVYTPTDGFTGQDRFTFKASDGTTDSNTATVTVTVSQVASPPVAQSQSVTATSGSPSDITLKATDPDGNALTYAIVSGPKSGTITDLNKDAGTLVYTPTDGFTGQDRFAFKASDGTTDSNTATVTVTVSQVASPPVAQSQSVTATSGSPSDITLKATDPDGNALTYAIVSGPKSERSQTSTRTLALWSTLQLTALRGRTGSHSKPATGPQTATPPSHSDGVSGCQPTCGPKPERNGNLRQPLGHNAQGHGPRWQRPHIRDSVGSKVGNITDLNKDTGTLVYTPTDGFTGRTGSHSKPATGPQTATRHR